MADAERVEVLDDFLTREGLNITQFPAFAKEEMSGIQSEPQPLERFPLGSLASEAEY